MKKTEQKYQAFVQILKEELIPAMGMYRTDFISVWSKYC